MVLSLGLQLQGVLILFVGVLKATNISPCLYAPIPRPVYLLAENSFIRDEVIYSSYKM